MAIYTDGGCHNNGIRKGDGSYAFLNTESECITDKTITVYGKKVDNTTNNRTELLAILHAINKYSSFDNLLIVSDSGYCVKGFTDAAYLDKWIANNWKTSSGSGVKNVDLWQKLYTESFHIPISMELCKGHYKDSNCVHAYYNDICDRACTFIMNNASIEEGDTIELMYHTDTKLFDIVEEEK